RITVGRVPLYLLDTNLEVNHPDDRALMNKLYAGGPDMRLRQEWILGVGGVRVLRALGINPAVWHANEGHAAFGVEQLESVAGPVWEEMKIDRDAFFHLGEHPDLPGQFHMTVTAMRLAAGVNGVSRRHGQVSRNIWRDLWPGRPWETVPIGHVTNGVHLATWMASPVMGLLDDHLGEDWGSRLDDEAL